MANVLFRKANEDAWLPHLDRSPPCRMLTADWQTLDSYRFIRKQEYFNKFMQLVGVGGCFGWSGRLYGRPIRVCCWAVVLQRVDGERGCWRGARRVVCERE